MSAENGEVEWLRDKLIALIDAVVEKERGKHGKKNWAHEIFLVDMLVPKLMVGRMTKRQALQIFMRETGRKLGTGYPSWVFYIFNRRVKQNIMIDAVAREICEKLGGNKKTYVQP